MASAETAKVLEQVQRSLEKVAATVQATTAKSKSVAPPPTTQSQQHGPIQEMAWSPQWTDGEAALEAIKNSQKIIAEDFETRGEKSLKFDFQRPSGSVMEVAQRAQYLLGKAKPIKILEVEEKQGRGWSKPPAGQIYGKKLGDQKVGGVRICFPAVNGMASTEVSIQIQLLNGSEGARPVTVQGTKAALMHYAKAWVMTYGPIQKLSQAEASGIDLDINGYL